MDIIAIGDALVDVTIYLDDIEFSELGFERGSQALISLEEKHAIEDRFHNRFHEPTSGGTEGNSVRAATRVGAAGAIISCVGDDRFGELYQQSMRDSGVQFLGAVITVAPTGVCFAFITPDGERTMRTFLGASKFLRGEHLAAITLPAAKWVSFNSYQFQPGENEAELILDAIQFAERHGAKSVISCGARWCVERHRDALRSLLPRLSLLVGNEREIAALGDENGEFLLQELSRQCDLIMTAGKRGAYYYSNGASTYIPTEPREFKNLTGAGDIFLGATLGYLAQDVPPQEAIANAQECVAEALG